MADKVSVVLQVELSRPEMQALTTLATSKFLTPEEQLRTWARAELDREGLMPFPIDRHGRKQLLEQIPYLVLKALVAAIVETIGALKPDWSIKTITQIANSKIPELPPMSPKRAGFLLRALGFKSVRVTIGPRHNIFCINNDQASYELLARLTKKYAIPTNIATPNEED